MFIRIRAIAAGIFFALLILYIGMHLARYTSLLQHFDGWQARSSDSRSVVTQVSADGPAAGKLNVGDEITAVNGRSVASVGLQGALTSEYRKMQPGDAYTLSILRRLPDGQRGSPETIELHTVRRSQWDIFRQLGGITGNVLIFAFAGLILFLLKPFDKQSVLLALMLGMFATFPQSIRAPLNDLPTWLIFLVQLPTSISLIFFSPIFLHFFLIFPEGPQPLSNMLRRWPKLERYIYAPALLLLLPAAETIAILMTFASPQTRLILTRRLTLVTVIGVSLTVTYVCIGLTSLVANYLRADELRRRRMRIVVIGSLTAFTPLLSLLTLSAIGFNYSNSKFLQWLDFSLIFLLPLMPLSFIYAIVRHRIIPVSFIIRRGARYLLVSHGSFVLELLVVGMTMFLFIEAVFRRTTWLTGRGLSVAAGLIAITIWSTIRWLHRRFIAPAIDKHFFRSAYDAHSILADLIESLRTVTGEREIFELTGNRIQEALHSSSIEFFVRDEGRATYSRAFAYSHDDEHLTAPLSESMIWILPDETTMSALLASTEPIEGSLDGIRSWLNKHEAEARADLLPEHEQGEGGSLLLALKGSSGLFGFVVIGPRLGDIPYSRDDKSLLTVVAVQLSLALENARLVERMFEQERQRQLVEVENERRAKELEEARQLQLSMLPTSLPEIPNIEIGAYMKPATEVGGDYYDFQLTKDGTLVIAVGDATGHGLKAGTMVTATKSLFRNFAPDADMPTFFRSTSRVLKEMNLKGLYMAMTLLKLKGNELTICAAGMPPILIHRGSDGRVEEISLPGMPLGSFPNYVYKPRKVELQAGDTVVLMSDGFPERMNAAGDMLGYDHAKEVLDQLSHLGPEALIEKLVERADEFAGGLAQDDDVTFVVLRMTEASAKRIFTVPEVASTGAVASAV